MNEIEAGKSPRSAFILHRSSFIVLLLLTLSLSAQTREERIDALLARLSFEEKLGQLSQYVPDQPEFEGALEKGLVGSLLNTGGAAQTNRFQRRALAARHAIPILIGHDVIHGYRTIFPIPLGIAATFDPAMAELSARIAAEEARAAGIRWTFAPMVDIARDPRWGRIAEGAGEDPHLGSVMAAAYVRGYQPTILATAKHFAGYGAPEGGRDYGPAEMSEQTLREVYLPPFQAALDAGVATFMSGFNTLNGVPAHANRHLLQSILREEWQFRGFVVSDFAGISELVNHRVAANAKEAAKLAITAGVDMAMWDSSYMKLGDRVPMAIIDAAVRRVLRAKFDAGLFGDPFTDESRAASSMLTPAAREAARRVARRSFVLLKNDGDTLPLAKNTRIHVAGALAESKADLLGSWAAEGKPEETPSIVEALRARGAKLVAREEADVLLAVVGETRDQSGEAASRTSLDLPAAQQELLRELATTGKPVVMIVLAGRPLSIPIEQARAIVQAWYPGTEGAAALVEVLFGDVNPSGKLPVTIPRNVGQVPIHHAMLPSGRPAHPENRFTNKYADVPIEPLYPFGHGLSYTKFEYSDLRVSPTSASVTVRNAGKRAGEEVVQMYVSDLVASVSRPVRALKSFQRLALAPGESKRVTFAIGDEQLRFWSDGKWIVEPGTFRVRIGGSSAEGLEAAFER